ncbi:hypothetical protein [Flavobacterium cheongpyeongense]|uniref:hypothetical protein n=1 Tax=Flavobacterium cheongpyeongense TaxID=2212651 RepID=UPI001404054F|nr:hypothetical protein [Flavobacterium cheongpyeongense]
MIVKQIIISKKNKDKTKYWQEVARKDLELELKIEPTISHFKNKNIILLDIKKGYN